MRAYNFSLREWLLLVALIVVCFSTTAHATYICVTLADGESSCDASGSPPNQGVHPTSGGGSSTGDCFLPVMTSGGTVNIAYCGDAGSYNQALSQNAGTPIPMQPGSPISPSNPVCQSSVSSGGVSQVTCSGGPTSTSSSTSYGSDQAPSCAGPSGTYGSSTCVPGSPSQNFSNSVCQISQHYCGSQLTCSLTGVVQASSTAVYAQCTATPGTASCSSGAYTPYCGNYDVGPFDYQCPSGWTVSGGNCTKTDNTVPQGIIQNYDGTSTTGGNPVGASGSITTTSNTNQTFNITYNGATAGVSSTNQQGGSAINPTGAVTCSSGQEWNGSSCSSVVCPAGQSYVGSSCISNAEACPGGEVLSGSSCVAPSGSGTGTGTSGTCPANQSYNSGTGTCTDNDAYTGSCTAPPSCTGDAVDCATANSVYSLNCGLVSNTTGTDNSSLAAAISNGSDPLASSLPSAANAAANPINVASTLSTATFLGGVGSISDMSVTLGSQTITIPFSDINPWITAIGYLVLATGFIMAAFIVGSAL